MDKNYWYVFGILQHSTCSLFCATSKTNDKKEEVSGLFRVTEGEMILNKKLNFIFMGNQKCGYSTCWQQQWQYSVADLVGGRTQRAPPPPRPKIFLISCSFSENLTKSYVGAPPEGQRPLLQGILDPPLIFAHKSRTIEYVRRFFTSWLSGGSWDYFCGASVNSLDCQGLKSITAVWIILNCGPWGKLFQQQSCSVVTNYCP